MSEAGFGTSAWRTPPQVAGVHQDDEHDRDPDGPPRVALGDGDDVGELLLEDGGQPSDEGEAADDPARGLELWLAGDMDGLEALGRAGMLGDPELREALLDARNHAWMNRIAPLVAEGRRPFVAVGAAHMLGAGGLPALLAARGYTVRRVQ